MKNNRFALWTAVFVCAGAFLLFALLSFLLPQAKGLLAFLGAVFFLLLSVNVHMLQRNRKTGAEK